MRIVINKQWTIIRSGSLVLSRLEALVPVCRCFGTMMLMALNELHALCISFVIFATLLCVLRSPARHGARALCLNWTVNCSYARKNYDIMQKSETVYECPYTFWGRYQQTWGVSRYLCGDCIWRANDVWYHRWFLRSGL